MRLPKEIQYTAVPFSDARKEKKNLLTMEKFLVLY